ncbi:uncharacterized protein LOC124188392 isoform X3 [Daphnia pulex]|uniref:uncharacterized protein LOC124188392 isoform X3 n=2 Tax=Daphnia pulex TaxID=6669 RepID=UPI001EDD9B69|nr:uncharacterized protein LOC124188392 isoform X3 [Daphnia pulex]
MAFNRLQGIFPVFKPQNITSSQLLELIKMQLKRGITSSVLSGLGDSDLKALTTDFQIGKTSISDTETALSTVWTTGLPSSTIISISVPEIISNPEGIGKNETLATEPTTILSSSTEETTVTSNIETSTTTAVKSSGTSQVALISTNEETSTSDTSPTADQSSATVTAPESTIPTTPTICNFNNSFTNPSLAMITTSSTIEISTTTAVISSGTSQVTSISTNESPSDTSPSTDWTIADLTTPEMTLSTTSGIFPTVSDSYTDQSSTEVSIPMTKITSTPEYTSENGPLSTEPTTNSSPSTEETTVTFNMETSTTTTVISSETSQVTSISTNEITSTSDTSPTTDWTSTAVTTPGSAPPTTPFCECDSLKLVLGTVLVGNSWFAVPLNSTTSNPECGLEKLIGLDVVVEGPTDKDEAFPSIVQNCSSSVDCLDGNDNFFIFNSSVCCENIIILQCSNYIFKMTPQYSTCVGNPDSTDGVIFTLPGPDAAPENVTVLDTGSDWITMTWQDLPFCLKTVNSFFMRFNPLDPNALGNNTINIEVPLNCTNRSFVTGVTDFDSKTCPELFSLDPCTNYSVTVEVEVFDMYLSQPSQSVTFNTKPPEDLVTQIGKIESGSDWLTFQWNLSVPQCQMATSGFRLNLTNSRNNSYGTYDCKLNTPPSVDSKFVFNTSSNDCGESVNVAACSDYDIAVIPKVFDLLYDGSPGSALGRTTCETIKAFIASIDSGSDWISFNWTTSVEDCRKVLTGFWLSIASTEQPEKQDSFQFISMNDCYCNLKEDQAIMFNTSKACNSWINPGIFPCSEYEIIIVPQFFNSFNGSTGPLNKTDTLPDDKMTPVTQNIGAGKNWISFEWQASLNTCRDAVTGLWISMKPSTSNERLCSLESTSDKFITFNTSSVCFNETLSPCTPYTFEIKLDINGKIGQFSMVIEMTTPGDDATALISNHKYGVKWISFWWQSSVPECQRFVTGYQLNVTDLFNGASQFKNLSRNCSIIISEQREFIFNSILNCTELVISPCSNYLISLAPVFRINDRTVINGVSAFIEIGTQSGEEGEIVNPKVISQGTNSLTLGWNEPKCRNLIYYNVTVMPNWKSEPRTYLKITPDCLDKDPSGNVSVILNATTCQNGYKFVSCAPYNIKVLPVYQLSSANEDLVGWANDTQTLPFEYEAAVSDLTVQNVGTRWISISWPIPPCRVNVSEWILSQTESDKISLPPDCPAKFDGNYLTLNISDTIVCSGSNYSIEFVPIIPCTNYTLGMNVKYPNWEVQNGSDNVISKITEVEPPGEVLHVTGNGTSNGIFLEWEEPRKNPQCVRGYQISWDDKQIVTTKTQYFLEGLEPCSRFPVRVNALPDSSIKESRIPYYVSTDSVAPAPIASEINVVKQQNGWTRNVSWLKPKVDDCISGYNINVIKTTSTEVVYNSTIYGKDKTWITLSEEFEQGNLYNISISSFCSFKEPISASDYVFHSFTWDSASNPTLPFAIVCGIVFPILALAIICSVVLIRKSSIFASERFSDDTRSTPSIHNKALNSRRPVMIKELRCTIQWLDANSNYELSKEYEMVKSLTDKMATCTVAQLPENRVKNRYSDILPYDHSRVKLTTVPPLLDYINASFISDYAGNRAYIASQGPKPSTIGDFWLMCFEQNVKVIVALTMLEERGKIKCAQYWPSTESCEFGDFYVKLTKEVIGDDYTTRDFLVSKISSNGSIAPKFIKQMHFTVWPDFGCPEYPEQLVNFIQAMRKESIYLNDKYRVNSPIVVHCSAGVGRTGTLIALDLLMEQARCKKIVDIVHTVLKLRKDRDRMVQTEGQYHFLYKCIYAYARNELQLSKLITKSTSNSTMFCETYDDIPLTPLSFFQKNPFANHYSRKSSFATV